MATHIVLPDTQAKVGVPTDHLKWVGKYIIDHFAGKPDVKVIHLGDHWDMPSLSSYDKKGSKSMETRRVLEDIKAGNDAWAVLNKPLDDYNKKRKQNKEKQWKPDKYLLRGNHCARISRAVEENPQMEGLLSLDLLKSPGWKVKEFLEVLWLDGIAYCHYFVNNANGKPISGMIETRIKQVGTTFVQGHQQGLKSGMVENIAGRRRGVVAGSCYLHTENYRGPQGQNEWRGILILHEVRDGDFDLMEVSLDYLARRYAGMPLDDYMAKHYPEIIW